MLKKYLGSTTTAAVILFMLAQTAFAEKVVYMDLIISRDDSVEEQYVIVTDGRPSQYYQRSGDYRLEVSDSWGRTIWSRQLDIFSSRESPVGEVMKASNRQTDNYSLSYKIPYSETAKKVILIHNEKQIYVKEIVACNGNGACDGAETHESCPWDCPITVADHVCSKEADGACDPDCSEGVDPDCKKGTDPFEAFPAIALVVALFGALAVAYRRLTDKKS